MSAPVEAVFYDGLTSRPRKAFVTVVEPGTLQVDVEPDGEDPLGLRILWPLEHEGMAWERTPTTLRLAFGEHPRRVVLVRDTLFIQSFVIRMRHVGRQGPYDRLLQVGRRAPVLLLLVTLALLVAGYFWGLPWAVERLALALPTSLDGSLGGSIYEGMAPTLSLDSARSEALQRFGERLDLAPDFELTYHVVDAGEVNAFALPGGHIVVYTGLLDKMDDAEQLVALLAHEATHVQERHSTRAVVRELSSSVFLALLVGDAAGVAAVAAGQADALRQLGYSRRLESEADAVGMERMAANGVDPQGMVSLLELLEREAQDMPEGLSFLSSHPLTTARIAAAQEKAKALGPAPALDAERERLFEALIAAE